MLDAAIFNDDTPLTNYRETVWRVVESQEEAATLSVVDDINEQSILEALLDDVKPVYRPGTESMHYLLKTAFRYPPLKWGSRFGTRLMPSYYYASELPVTALRECAYYRFLFLQDMQQPYLEPIRSEYCVFSALVASEYCLDLEQGHFASIHDHVSDPSTYQDSQLVGRWAYERGDIELIRFRSARHRNGANLAISEPRAIRSRKPKVQERWLCLTKPQVVSFSSRGAEVSYVFSLSDYCDENGSLMRAG